MPALSNSLTQKLNFGGSSAKRIYALILILAIFSGSATGYILASSKSPSTVATKQTQGPITKAQQDNKTFKDFAEGTIQKKPDPKKGQDYGEGTHLLIRQNAVPVALTSSVVDLSQYEGKKVKVFGETQKALKEGWLMDVGRVEVQ
jgi:hypothetical protein